MKEKKDRVDDALHATKAALEEGILPGGGVALLNAADKLAQDLAKEEKEFSHPDQEEGYVIIINAIQKPFIQILENAGYDKQGIKDLISATINDDNKWTGYNPRKEEMVNMFDEGIIDPAKVTRLALENAASVAGTMLITEAVVSNIKGDKDTGMDGGIDPSMLLG